MVYCAPGPQFLRDSAILKKEKITKRNPAVMPSRILARKSSSGSTIRVHPTSVPAYGTHKCEDSHTSLSTVSKRSGPQDIQDYQCFHQLRRHNISVLVNNKIQSEKKSGFPSVKTSLSLVSFPIFFLALLFAEGIS